MNKQIALHDNTQVTVLVFDARAMIVDILANSELMNDNIADCYDILTGTMDANHEANKH